MIVGNLDVYGRTGDGDTGQVPHLNVNEIFGPVWQGEGPATGERCAFLRLANCNLNCGKGEGSTWACDTPYTWDWSTHDHRREVHPMEMGDVLIRLREVMGHHTRLLVVSGGEPLLQARALGSLVDHLDSRGVDVDIETNGTRSPLFSATPRRYVCSPKLANSGVPRAKRIKPDVLKELTYADVADLPTAFKFVATRPSDLAEVDDLVDECGLTNVWIMPGGTTTDEILTHAQFILPAVEARGYNLSLRQQVLLHGDTRAT